VKTTKNCSFSERRYVELVVISDVHLGTYGCHARELVNYLRSIRPGTLVLNGDIIDMWQFSKKYFPKSHMKVLKEIIHMASKGVEVVYITGNHDELLRKFAGFNLGKLSIQNKLLLDLDDKKAWIFHGDIFDVTMQHAKWLTRLGAIGYDSLIVLNAATNFILEKAGREKISLSKKVKSSVKSAVKYINRFEQTCAEIAINNQYDYVVCGHIHQPEIRDMSTNDGTVTYLNSGDWVENLTALEYQDGNWQLYQYKEHYIKQKEEPEEEYVLLSNKELFARLLEEINSSGKSEPSHA
jgi:UDP-2,3-diacylglucosamine pyrophosphatase LpxH